MITKDFEKYYPLPWRIDSRQSCYDMGYVEDFIFLNLNGDRGAHASKGVPSLIDFTARNRVDMWAEGYSLEQARMDALKYLVKCANLMPEAVELLKSADEKLLALCRTCDNAMSDAGLGRFVDCKNCNVESLDTSIKELLAKLEGGAEDERD